MSFLKNTRKTVMVLGIAACFGLAPNPAQATCVPYNIGTCGAAAEFLKSSKGTPASLDAFKAFTNMRSLDGISAGAKSAMASATQTDIMKLLDLGKFADAKALLTKTAGGAAILSAIPDYMDKINKYIDYAKGIAGLASGSIAMEDVLKGFGDADMKNALAKLMPDMSAYMDQMNDMMGKISDLKSFGATIMASDFKGVEGLISGLGFDKMLSGLADITDLSNLADLSKLGDLTKTMDTMKSLLTGELNIPELISKIPTDLDMSSAMGLIEKFVPDLSSYMDQFSGLTSKLDDFKKLGDTVTALDPSKFNDLIKAESSTMLTDFMKDLPTF